MSVEERPVWFEKFVESCNKEDELLTVNNVRAQCIAVHTSRQILVSVHPLILAKYLHFTEAQFNLGIHN